MGRKSTTESLWRQAMRMVGFAVTACILFIYLNLAVIYKGDDMSKGAFDAFYALPENSVDVVYIGNSGASRYYVQPVAFNEYGIAGFTIGMPSCPAFLMQDIIREVELTQHPKLYVIEIRGLRRGDKLTSEEQVRKTTDVMDLLSSNRVSMITKALDRTYDRKSSFIEYLIPIFKYHSRAASGDLTLDDLLLRAPVNSTFGYALGKPTVTQSPQPETCYTDACRTLSSNVQENISELVSFCNTLDAHVLFVESPFSVSEIAFAKLNSVRASIEEADGDVLDMMTEEAVAAMGLDWSTDFYDNAHLNYLGAEKYTAYVSEYLKSHYDLPDRRANTDYDIWVQGFNVYADYTSGGIRYHNEVAQSSASSESSSDFESNLAELEDSASLSAAPAE